MSNALSEEQKQQGIALGKLGWSLRRIERETGVRRETAGVYLKTAGVTVRLPGWGRWSPAKPAIQVTTDPELSKPANPINPNPETLPSKEKPEPAKPAMEVTTDSGAPSVTSQGPPTPPRPSASACEPYRELIEQGLSRGRNAMAIWQDLVSDHGFTGRYNSVKRFVRKLHGVTTPEARVVIETARGEEAQVDYGDGPMVRDP